MEYSIYTVLNDTVQSIAIPFRILEIFTTTESIDSKINATHNNNYLKEIFSYLIKNKYFEQIKKLIEAKVPPLLEPSAMPPTPLAKWFLEMIQRSLYIVNQTENFTEFCFLILHEFCSSILSQKMTEPITHFIIPALIEFKEFPYNKLIKCVNRLNFTPSISLFYCILSLEPSACSKSYFN